VGLRRSLASCKVSIAARRTRTFSASETAVAPPRSLRWFKPPRPGFHGGPDQRAATTRDQYCDCDHGYLGQRNTYREPALPAVTDHRNIDSRVHLTEGTLGSSLYCPSDAKR